jgi:hypothetical protein
MIAAPPSCGEALALRRPPARVNGRHLATSVRVLLADDHPLFREGLRGSSKRPASTLWAKRLVVSENTAKYHRRNIPNNLRVQNRAQVVAYSVRHGISAAGS